jgi:PTS system nitrogen regulatory IIA component
MTEELMSVRELSEYLRVNVSTLYIWSHRGKIPAMKVGNLWRYRRSEIDAWLEECRRAPVHPQAVSE